MGGKTDAFGVSFLLLLDLLGICPLGTVKTLYCQKCYLVYPCSQDLRVNPPSSQEEAVTKALVVP